MSESVAHVAHSRYPFATCHPYMGTAAAAKAGSEAYAEGQRAKGTHVDPVFSNLHRRCRNLGSVLLSSIDRIIFHTSANNPWPYSSSIVCTLLSITSLTYFGLVEPTQSLPRYLSRASTNAYQDGRILASTIQIHDHANEEETSIYSSDRGQRQCGLVQATGACSLQELQSQEGE